MQTNTSLQLLTGRERKSEWLTFVKDAPEAYIFQKPLNQKGNIDTLFVNVNRKLDFGGLFSGLFYTNEYYKKKLVGEKKKFATSFHYIFLFC